MSDVELFYDPSIMAHAHLPGLVSKIDAPGSRTVRATTESELGLYAQIIEIPVPLMDEIVGNSECSLDISTILKKLEFNFGKTAGKYIRSASLLCTDVNSGIQTKFHLKIYKKRSLIPESGAYGLDRDEYVVSPFAEKVAKRYSDYLKYKNNIPAFLAVFVALDELNGSATHNFKPSGRIPVNTNATLKLKTYRILTTYKKEANANSMELSDIYLNKASQVFGALIMD